LRRFYKKAGTAKSDSGFAVTLDGKVVRTFAGTAMALSSRALAEAIAQEWQAQGEKVDLHGMPLMRLAVAALDYVAPERDAVVASMLEYAKTDLLCYRVVEPADLAERQALVWQPLVDWAASRFGAPLAVTVELTATPQPAASLAALEVAISDLDDLRLTGLRGCTGICRSLILGLALTEGRIDAEAAWKLSQLDEDFQIERWGEDEEATEQRAALRASLDAVERFLSLLG